MMRAAFHRAGAVVLQRTCSERRSAVTLGVALLTPIVSPSEDPGARARRRYVRERPWRRIQQKVLATSLAAKEAKQAALADADRIPSLLGSRRLWRLWRAIQRLTWIGTIVVPGLVLYPVAALLERVMPSLNAYDCILSYSLWGIETLGPTFIKFIQWASTRPDLFPATLVSKFSHLADSVTAHPWSETVRTLEVAFGSDWRERLRLEAEPIGSGCVAQVYKGQVLACANEVSGDAGGTDEEGPREWHKVAVKLIHPHVKEKVEADMDILLTVAWKMQQWFKSLHYLSLYETAKEFSDNLQLQLDLRVEANNLSRFCEFFADDDYVQFPRPLNNWTSEFALVETFLDGEPIVNYMNSDDKEFKKAISDKGTASILKMIFDDNLVHGDLHPGNILVKRIPGDPTPVIGYLDAGICTEMDRSVHKQLIDICLAFLKRDGYLAGRHMVEYTDSDELPLNGEAFCKGIQKMQEDALEDLYFEKFGEYWTTTCGLACDHRVKINSKFLAIGLALRVVEGVNLHLDPDLDVVTAAIPVAAKAQMRYLRQDAFDGAKRIKNRTNALRRRLSKMDLTGG